MIGFEKWMVSAKSMFLRAAYESVIYLYIIRGSINAQYVYNYSIFFTKYITRDLLNMFPGTFFNMK